MMSTLTLSDELVERIQKIAQSEGRAVEDVIAGMIEQLYSKPTVDDDETPHHNPLHGLVGLLDDDIKETDRLLVPELAKDDGKAHGGKGADP